MTINNQTSLNTGICDVLWNVNIWCLRTEQLKCLLGRLRLSTKRSSCFRIFSISRVSEHLWRSFFLIGYPWSKSEPVLHLPWDSPDFLHIDNVTTRQSFQGFCSMRRVWPSPALSGHWTGPVWLSWLDHLDNFFRLNTVFFTISTSLLSVSWRNTDNVQLTGGWGHVSGPVQCQRKAQGEGHQYGCLMIQVLLLTGGLLLPVECSAAHLTPWLPPPDPLPPTLCLVSSEPLCVSYLLVTFFEYQKSE